MSDADYVDAVTSTSAVDADVSRVDRYVPGSVAQRLGSLLVDGLLFVCTVAVPATLASWWFGPEEFSTCVIRGSSESCSITPEALRYTRTVFYGLAALWLLAFAALIRNGASVGKKATETMVVDATTGDTIGYGRALVRTLLAVLGLACFGIGLLAVLADRRRRALHDRVVGTLVISN